MLGLRFARLVRAAIASGALVLAACPDNRQDTDTDTDATSDTESSTDGPTTIDPTTGPPDPPPPPPGDVTPPALVSATLLDPQALKLTFTEPIAPVDTVNPKRFRFSLAVGYFGTYGGQPQTFIRDPRYFNYSQYCQPCEPPYGCYYQPYYCYYQPSDEILVAELYNHYADPNSLLLFLTEPIRPSLCNAVNQGGDNQTADAVLHLHYADGGLSQITDLAGIPLGPDGKFWVGYDGNYYVYNAPAFSNFTPFVPIPCDFV